MSNDSIVKFRFFDKVETTWTFSICFDIVERIDDDNEEAFSTDNTDSDYPLSDTVTVP